MPYKDPEKRKEYSKKYNKSWYQNNRQKRLEQIRKRKKSIRKQLNEYKIENKCFKCREDHPAALDFHHIEDKNFLVSKMIGDGYSINSIMNEVKKCMLLCANCHRLEHYGQTQSSSI